MGRWAASYDHRDGCAEGLITLILLISMES